MKLLLTLLSLIGILYGQEHFLTASWENSKGTYTQQKSFCQNNPKRELFCEKSALSYPLFVHAPDAAIATRIERILEKPITDFSKENLPKSVWQTIAENRDYPPHGTWENSSSIDLFAITPGSFTLRDISSGYTGGAHGYYSVRYSNYAPGSDKLLTLSDLFITDYNATLQKIAQRVYREHAGLLPRESLTKDGWFENKFILTSNFAITPRGLLFHYNSYEIKPYAAGHTTFMLPYFYLHHIIDPDGILSPYRKLPQKTEAKYSQDELASLRLQVMRTGERKVRIHIDMEKQTWLQHAWLSLSFPQIRHTSAVISTSTSGLQNFQRYPAGSRIYNVEQKKEIRSDYLLLEAESKKWSEDETKQLAVTLQIPKNISVLKIRVRAVFKDGKKFKKFPDFEGTKGQQGFYNYEVLFPLALPLALP
jgi:hypothetical protein